MAGWVGMRMRFGKRFGQITIRVRKGASVNEGKMEQDLHKWNKYWGMDT
jgi:hypothetical protein